MSRLSVAIVARNEAGNIERALASVVDLAAQIIVTDTGSADRTVEIARGFGAQIEFFAWCDDFSAAHNFSNAKATGDWLLMLDADEELLVESRDELQRSLTDDRVLAYSVLRQDLLDADRPAQFTEMRQLRLIRNVPELHLQGRCHHHFVPSLGELASQRKMELRESGIRLRHYGYTRGLHAEKNRRAARLLELEVKERPGQFYYVVEYGLTLLALGNTAGWTQLAEAADMVAEGKREALDGGTPLALLLETVLANPALPSGFPLTRTKASELAAARFPNAVPLLWQMACHHNAQGRFSECARLLERILKLNETGTYDRHVSFDPAIMGDDARLNLGVCYVRLGELSKAKQCFCALLTSTTRGGEAARNLKAIERLRS